MARLLPIYNRLEDLQDAASSYTYVGDAREITRGIRKDLYPQVQAYVNATDGANAGVILRNTQRGGVIIQPINVTRMRTRERRQQ